MQPTVSSPVRASRVRRFLMALAVTAAVSGVVASAAPPAAQRDAAAASGGPTMSTNSVRWT
jgi:hypothetical protein